MTHNQWEQGKRLTIHNATKEQVNHPDLRLDVLESGACKSSN